VCVSGASALEYPSRFYPSTAADCWLWSRTATLRRSTYGAPRSFCSVLAFAREIDYYAMHDALTTDFADQTFFSPFAILFIGAKLRAFRQKNPGLRLEFSNYREHEYPRADGIFSHVRFRTRS
jgi:hypothetical protein